MNSLQVPLSEYLVSFYIQKPVAILDDKMSKKIIDTIEQIKTLTESKGIEVTIESMRSGLFNLKIKLIPILAKDEQFFSDYYLKLTTEINNLRYSTDTLGKTVAEILAILSAIADTFVDTATPELFKSIALPNYNSFQALAALLPDKTIKKLVDFIDCSLDLECAMIIADLVIKGQIVLSQKESKLLHSLLLRIAEDFTLFALQEGLISKQLADISPIHRNAKIRLAMYQLETNTGRRMAADELRLLLSA